jgi:hypothetical protein
MVRQAHHEAFTTGIAVLILSLSKDEGYADMPARRL